MSFLPPAPKNAVLVDPVAEAPRVEANLYLPSSPSLVNPAFQVPPRPTAADMRIRRAEEKYQNGRRLYEQGRADEARREFDGAIDVLLGAPDDLPDRSKIEKKLESLVAAIYRHDVNGMGLADLSQQAWDKAPLEDILEMTFPVDPAIKPIVQDQVKATVSQLPLEVNDTVLSYINFFSSERGRRTLLTGLKRAGRYRELISRTLAEEGVPQELIYLAQAESGFLPRAVSYKSATGMWQFMRSRGREYGLAQSAHHDDRLDPEKATRSAARHLNDLYKKFGDWYLAIAAYNCGDGCVERAVARTGYADFWQLRARRAIPRETTNYVPIIVAMTIMAKNPKAYGLEEIEVDAPIEYDKVDLQAPAHLALVADLVDRPVSELRDLNPALLRNIAPASYELKIPKGTEPSLMAGLAAIPEGRWQSARVHRVSDGESAATLAKRYRTSPGSIVEIGDMLVVPTATEQARAAKTKATHRNAQTRYSKSGSRAAAKSTPSRSAGMRRGIGRGAVLAYR
ncbi:MAG TPA: transglycosylase SLT domain-containing protein [Bryobacteraceae bacterium]|nr:transglycosylase SLT domain-containing protein [Bryobacteraceae bacterium]